MKDKSKLGLEILQTAALTGILGDVLLRRLPWGINATLFLVFAATAYMFIARRRRPDLWTNSSLALCGALMFFGAMFAWRDAEELVAYDVIASLAILALLIVPSLGVNLRFAGVIHILAGFVWSGINVALSPFFLLLTDIEWKTTEKSGWKSSAVAVVRGILIATPLIVVFGALFMAADAVFEGIVDRTFKFDPSVVFPHVVFTCFLSWVTAGYLRGAFMDMTPDAKAAAAFAGAVSSEPEFVSVTDDSAPEAAPAAEGATKPAGRKNTLADFDNSILPSFLTLGPIEIGIVLGLMNLLFLIFVVIQLPYLFGGHELVVNTPDFKLSEYARRGFGELVAVAALVLPILLASNWLLRRDKPLNDKLFRALAGVQIVLLFVIMASAAQRLFLLTGSFGYGLTTTRFYPFVFMMWLAVVFVWFAATVLRGARRSFAWGAFWSAIVILGALHFVNPDDFIARTNLRLRSEGRRFDAGYNARLSDDAVPALVSNLGNLNEDERAVVASRLADRLCRQRTETDYRTFNISRFLARRALESGEAAGSIVVEPGYCGRSLLP